MPKTILQNGRKIRVLVVDDSVVIRRLVTQALSEDPELEVVGSAPNGKIALQRIPQLNPDVLTLDVEMPEMDGLQTLRALRPNYPHLVVIMFSTLTQRGASSTIEALSYGASDYVTKAANVGSLDRSLQSLRSELVPKIKQFFHRPGGDRPSSAQGGASARSGPITLSRASRLARGPRRLIAIGVSTGGPTALAEVFPGFPQNLDVPIVIVQHMPPMFTRLLAERLQQISRLKVREAEPGMPLEPGVAVIAPGDYHLTLRRDGTQVLCALNQGPPENSCRPAVDVLFRSVADLYGGSVVAVILTGMGQDGLRGVETLKAAGAYVLAQDEPSSVVWGMPGAVARAGLADTVAPLAQIAPEILRRLKGE